MRQATETPLQVARVATARATCAFGIELRHRRDERPWLADQRRGARSHDRDEFVGVDGEAALRIHLPDEAQRMATFLRRTAKAPAQVVPARVRGTAPAARPPACLAQRARARRLRGASGAASAMGGSTAGGAGGGGAGAVASEEPMPASGAGTAIATSEGSSRCSPTVTTCTGASRMRSIVITRELIERLVVTDHAARRRRRADQHAVVAEHRDRLDIGGEQPRHAFLQRQIEGRWPRPRRSARPTCRRRA